MDVDDRKDWKGNSVDSIYDKNRENLDISTLVNSTEEVLHGSFKIFKTQHDAVTSIYTENNGGVNTFGADTQFLRTNYLGQVPIGLPLWDPEPKEVLSSSSQPIEMDENNAKGVHERDAKYDDETRIGADCALPMTISMPPDIDIDQIRQPPDYDPDNAADTKMKRIRVPNNDSYDENDGTYTASSTARHVDGKHSFAEDDFKNYSDSAVRYKNTHNNDSKPARSSDAKIDSKQLESQYRGDDSGGSSRDYRK
jgi:hypothetical protein